MRRTEPSELNDLLCDMAEMDEAAGRADAEERACRAALLVAFDYLWEVVAEAPLSSHSRHRLFKRIKAQ